ncbi:small multi-drug export protein [Natrialba sp. SSL1]|nr:small multi-drug export protein [Natrialba sp. SSL1]
MDFTASFDVGTALEESAGIARYLLVFVFAMVPAVEPFIVIPAAIGLGLDPFATGIAAFAGSVTAVSLVVVFQYRLQRWWARRQAQGDDSAPGLEYDAECDAVSRVESGVDSGEPEHSQRSEPTGRYGRARRIWDRYGLPGLAVAGPILAGIHLTALLALIVDDRPRVVVAWLTVGLGAWTVVLVATSVLGFALLGL